jgi:hypothetical protein
METDWGDVPTWITALIALGGALYGTLSLHQLRRDRISAQARLIYVISDLLEPQPGDTGLKIRFEVRNTSTLPINNVVFRFKSLGNYQVSLPERVDAQGRLVWITDEIIVKSAVEDNPIRVNFTDNEGWRWMRYEGQRLMPAYRGLNERWRSSSGGRAFRRLVPRPIRRYFRDRYRLSRFRPYTRS